MIEVLSDLVNARLVAHSHPATFSRPSDEDLKDVRVGDHVKVCRHNERFWIKVERIAADQLLGGIANDLVRPDNSDLHLGDLVCVERDHVYDVYKAGGAVTDDESTNLINVRHDAPAYRAKPIKH